MQEKLHQDEISCLVLRGKFKDRVEIQWNEETPIKISLVPVHKKELVLYSQEIEGAGKLNFCLKDLDFSHITSEEQLDIVAITEKTSSEKLAIQKCHHQDCGKWGHVREDGYCKHCGRRIRAQCYTRGFPKLELTFTSVSLWNGKKGNLWKTKETNEEDDAVYSLGQYEDEDYSKSEVDILEEKFVPEQSERYAKLYELLEENELIHDKWIPPLASFQEEHQRSLWVYYPRLFRRKSQDDWTRISAYSYITNKKATPLKTEEIISIGIQLCEVAEVIHSQGHFWGSLKLSHLIFLRNKKGPKFVDILLRNRDIAWDESSSRKFLDTCLIPWELYNDTNLTNRISEVTEVYIIAAALYLLQAKFPNLLSYNSISYQNSLPSLKLFKSNETNSVCTSIYLDQYFEEILNKALILHPDDRGYHNLREFKLALQRLLKSDLSTQYDELLLEVGDNIDIGDGKREEDLTPNQDDLFVTTMSLETKRWGMFVLCDGISTATLGSGEMASQTICDTFREWWANSDEMERKKVCSYALNDFSAAKNFLHSLALDANEKISEKIYELSLDQELSENTLVMGSTINAGLVYDNILYFGWLGDSPIYKFGKFGWQRLNFEDNERNERLLDGALLENVFNEGGNALTRCVGAHFYGKGSLPMNFGYTCILPGEFILICSDGIPDYIEQELAFTNHENYQMMRLHTIISNYSKDPLVDAKALAAILISSANRIGGGHDNLSAILIEGTSYSHNSHEKSYEFLRKLSKPL